MTGPPRIGITSWPRVVKGSRTPLPNDTVPRSYSQAVRRGGGIPVILPVVDAEDLDLLLDVVDGVVVIGGGDLDPAAYGHEAHPETRSVDPERDDYDAGALERAIERGLPALGICRALQVLNVMHGGTLQQHLPHHDAHDKPSGGAHVVTVEQGTCLAEVVGTGELAVNSLHHQGIDRLGAGLRATARSADGLVEAIELADSPHLIAVQWHPELLTDHPEQLALFEDLASRAETHRSRG